MKIQQIITHKKYKLEKIELDNPIKDRIKYDTIKSIKRHKKEMERINRMKKKSKDLNNKKGYSPYKPFWNKKAQFDFLEVDMDVVYSPAYWILAGGSTLAMIIGLSATKAGSKVAEFLSFGPTEYIMPWYIKLVLIIAMPIISYFVVQHFQ